MFVKNKRKLFTNIFELVRKISVSKDYLAKSILERRWISLKKPCGDIDGVGVGM